MDRSFKQINIVAPTCPLFNYQIKFFNKRILAAENNQIAHRLLDLEHKNFHGCIFIGHIFNRKIPIFFYNAVEVSVSYTHLDVYKRQL